jgi:hypothetical protein
LLIYQHSLFVCPLFLAEHLSSLLGDFSEDPEQLPELLLPDFVCSHVCVADCLARARLVRDGAIATAAVATIITAATTNVVVFIAAG